ncbi:MAG TPA: hypothetical protein VE870_01210 [Bacteroidales bacterium]|nr:hypothetical protein [Bacteroidales bacterium]
MKILLPIILLAMLLPAGCHSGETGKKKDTVGEAETVRSFRKIENLRFGFTAKIPADWDATDKSDNGDGFVINLPSGQEGDADIRMYGSYEPLSSAEIDKDTLEIFGFADGMEGQALKDGGTLVVQRILGKNRFVVFSVKERQQGWIDANQKLLMTIAESMTPVKPD